MDELHSKVAALRAVRHCGGVFLKLTLQVTIDIGNEVKEHNSFLDEMVRNALFAAQAQGDIGERI